MFNYLQRWFKGYRVVDAPKYLSGKQTIEEPDPIVATVMKRMSDRSKMGMEKYGCTMMRDDLKAPEWIDHTIEELLDAAVYLERLKVDLNDRRR